MQETPLRTAARRLFWSAAWLAALLVAIKAYYLGLPPALTVDGIQLYVRSLAAISYVDVLVTAVIWMVARTVVVALSPWPRAVRGATAVFLVVTALSCSYALGSVIVFGVFGGFVTYPLLALVGDISMLGSSAAAYLTLPVAAGLMLLPLAHLTLVRLTVRLVPARERSTSRNDLIIVASVGLWLALGHYAYASEWATKRDRKIADNPQWVLISSWWEVVTGDGVVRMDDHFPAGDLADFATIGSRPQSPVETLRRAVTPLRAGAPAERPMNVVLVVLESVGARWTSLSGGLYDTTPTLKAEARNALVVDNFYAHIGRSSNSLAAMLLSTYPKLDFRDFTEEFSDPPGTSLAASFRDRGYRTAFMMPSYFSWAGWGTFLESSGFADLRDATDMPCSPELSSWGVEDRCLVDSMLEWIDQNGDRPFFLLGWTDQTHHPYEPTPGAPELDLVREKDKFLDDYDLGRYLNVLRETDRQLARLFEKLRQKHLADNTLVVVVGDHGQAFGYPHHNFMQGSAVYEEDVHVPFMIWSPRLYRTGQRSPAIASHVDLAPTIAELAGLPAAADWQGHSLFDRGRPSRAYFYVAEDGFTLGVREGQWKYIYDLREGTEELYDLTSDPIEWKNVAKDHTALSTRFRQRLAAWTEANRRQYEP